MADRRKHRTLAQLIAPAAVIAVVGLMIVPLPPFLLDLLLSVDIGLAVVLLLTALYVRQPVEFSVFPSLLLLLTLLRLSLNVAGTRLILLHGAGRRRRGRQRDHVVRPVRGRRQLRRRRRRLPRPDRDPVRRHQPRRGPHLGSHGAVHPRRHARQADGDRRRPERRHDRRARGASSAASGSGSEADFYGAMDGAIRFTQRDALAALLITGVNIVAGLIIGVLQHGLDLATAARTYTILTVGEGLVTAIPALLVSMSGGLITTRAASESNLGEEVAGQLLRARRPLGVAAGVLVALALIPGLPKLAFLTGRGACSARPPTSTAKPEASERRGRSPRRRRRPTRSRRAVAVDPLSVEVGYALISLVDEKQGGTLLHARPRHPAPDRHRDRHGRAAGARGRQPAARAARLLHPRQGRRSGARRALPRPAARHQPGHGDRARSTASQTREPAFGLPAWWIAAEQRDRAIGRRLHRRRSDDGAVDAPVGDRSAPSCPTCSAASRPRTWSTASPQTSPKLVEELVPKIVSLGDIQRVLRQLLRERVPVKDLTTILEAHRRRGAGDEGPRRDDRGGPGGARPGDLPAVPERQGRTAGHQPRAGARGAAAGGRSSGRSRAPCWRSTRRRPSTWPRGSRAPSRAAVAQPVLLCSPGLRPHLWRLFSRVLPQIGVLSHNEVPSHVRVTSDRRARLTCI